MAQHRLPPVVVTTAALPGGPLEAVVTSLLHPNATISVVVLTNGLGFPTQVVTHSRELVEAVPSARRREPVLRPPLAATLASTNHPSVRPAIVDGAEAYCAQAGQPDKRLEEDSRCSHQIP